MLVSHNKKFIFLKTIKTASTSIEQVLQKYCSDKEYYFDPENPCFPEDSSHKETSSGIITVPLFFRNNYGEVVRSKYWDHMTGQELKVNLGEEIWQNYKKFCIVRNPFDKVVSIFYFIIRDCFIGEQISTQQLFEYYVPIILTDELFNDKMIYTINGDICVDQIIRFENLEKDFYRICDTLNVKETKIPKINSKYRTKSIKCKDIYTDYTKKLVSDRYQFEIETFGYRFPE